MKRIIFFFLILCSMAVTAKPKYVVVAYVSGGATEIPDPTLMTHINYAFGYVNETYSGVTIENPEFLKQITALKKKKQEITYITLHWRFGCGGIR